MHNQYIDDLINYKLKQLKLMLDPADWNRLEKKFSEALQNHIAQKLSNYEAELESSDWPALNTLLNEAFDLQIKNILAAHALSLEPSDWGLLAASLDEEPFDQAIAQQLHGLESTLEKEDWKLFAAKLDEHTLDTQIREQLEDLEFQLDSSDWDSFESKIESTFDTQVKDKLSGLSLRASSNDWKQMMALLDGDSFISEIREALDGVEIQLPKREDWKAMEDKLNQPLYTAFQEKFAFHAIAPLKGDWKAMESLLKEEEDPKPILLPWYIKHRVYLTAASVLILFILSPFWIGKDSKLRNSVRNFTFNIEANPSQEDTTETISDKNIASAIPAPSVNNRLPESIKQGDISDPFALVSAGTDAVINSIKVGLPTSTAPKQLEAQPAVAIQAPELKGEGVHIKNPEPIASNEKKQSPKVNLGDISREGLLRSIPFQSFANPWMMGPDSHAKEIKKVSGFKRRRQAIRLGLHLGTSKTVVELSSPKATTDNPKKKFGQTFITGVRAEFNIKRNLYFVTGLNYEKRQFEHQYQFFPTPELTPLRPYPENPIDQFISADIQMLELPLLLRLLGESKNNLAGYLQVGVVPMISLQERYKHWEDTDLPSFEVPTSQSLPDSESQTQDWRFNTYAGNINGAMGLDYRLNNELSIGLEVNGFISFQRTKGSGSLNLQKKMYTGGIAVSLMRGLSRK